MPGSLTALLALASLAPALILGQPNVSPSSSTAPVETAPLAGLWEAKNRLGPDIRGPLLIWHRADRWWAEIEGQCVPATLIQSRITFMLRERKSRFEGRFEGNLAWINGHWIQSSNYASPVTLTRRAGEQRLLNYSPGCQCVAGAMPKQWRRGSNCPRHSTWEDALIDDLVEVADSADGASESTV
jgi:hypothetical protein